MKKKKNRANNPAKCFWFSGIPGTKVQHALAALAEEFRKQGRLTKIISLERRLCSVFARKTHPNDHDARAALVKEFEKLGGFKRLLNEPPPRILEMWKEAIRLVAQEAKNDLTNGYNVFFTFHAVYYADKYGDFYSPIDALGIKSVPPPEKFLTLIDDIGDIAARLREEGQIFSHRARTGLQSAREAIQDLLTILEWRATEFTASRLIGGLINCPPFLLAVKHPVQTAKRILLNEGDPAYISHPISEARRDFKSTGDWPLMKEIQRFTDSLSSAEVCGSLIPIVPTAIDELRFRTVKIQGSEVLIPALLDRWDPPSRVPLVQAADYRDGASCLDPSGYFIPLLKSEPVSDDIQRQIETLAGLLEALFARITNQINARDHILVSQCPHFVVYRPYEAWRMSGGVTAEVVHRQSLLQTGKVSGLTIFCHKPDDNAKRKFGTLLEETILSFKWCKGPKDVPSQDIETVLKGKWKAGHRPASFSADDIGEYVCKAVADHGITLNGLRSQQNAKKVLGQYTATEAEAAVKEEWRRISTEVQKPIPWKGRSEYWKWIEKDFTPEAFASELNSPISNSRIKRARR